MSSKFESIELEDEMSKKNFINQLLIISYYTPLIETIELLKFDKMLN